MSHKDLNNRLVPSKLELLQRMFELGKLSFKYLMGAEKAKSVGDFKSYLKSILMRA
jgi:hypothetical protein